MLIEPNEIDNWTRIVNDVNKVWNISKSQIKRRVKLYQSRIWIESEEGKVLKQYKNEWWDDTMINEVKDKYIHVIKRLRIGNSKLKSHRKQGGLGWCENCNMNVPETNEHFLFKCNKYEEQRNKLFHKISRKMKIMKINIDIYNLLGFYPTLCKSKRKIKMHKDNIMYIYQCVCEFIESTHRFDRL